MGPNRAIGNGREWAALRAAAGVMAIRMRRRGRPGASWSGVRCMSSGISKKSKKTPKYTQLHHHERSTYNPRRVFILRGCGFCVPLPVSLGPIRQYTPSIFYQVRGKETTAPPSYLSLAAKPHYPAAKARFLDHPTSRLLNTQPPGSQVAGLYVRVCVYR